MIDLIEVAYIPELTELARGSEGGCAVFEWIALTNSQKNAVKAIILVSGQVDGDISYGNFIVRVIQQKYVSVLQKAIAIPEKDIY